eukprot:865225_1
MFNTNHTNKHDSTNQTSWNMYLRQILHNITNLKHKRTIQIIISFLSLYYIITFIHSHHSKNVPNIYSVPSRPRRFKFNYNGYSWVRFGSYVSIPFFYMKKGHKEY